MNIEKEREAFEEAWLLQHELKYFEFDSKDRQYFLKESVTGTPDAEEAYHTINSGWSMWLKAKAHEAKKLEGCVVVPVEMPDSFDDALYMYSNDISVVNSESDGFIPMADLDHGKVWQLVVEAARGGNE